MVMKPAPARAHPFPLQLTIASAVIGRIEAASNRGDAVAVAAGFARSAVWTNALGTRIVGRGEIEAAGEGLLPLLAEGGIRCEVVGVTPLRADLIAVNVIHHAASPDGRELPEAASCALYLIGREAEGWLVLAGQATILNEIE